MFVWSSHGGQFMFINISLVVLSAEKIIQFICDFLRREK